MRVQLDNVRKQFSGVAALMGVSLDVPAGRSLALLGPSGSGKSTLLRILAGLERPTEGRVLFDERDVTAADPSQRGVGLVVQDAGLYPHLTLRESLAVAGRGADLAAEVVRAGEALGITAALDRRPGEVSGGQRRRAALARELIRKPRVLLLDEPCASLDPESAREARAMIAGMRATLGCTVVLATHDQDEAFAMGDEVAVMSAGEVVQVAPAREVYRRPANRCVATFVGRPAMNFIRGRIEPGTPPRFVAEGTDLPPLDLPGLHGHGLAVVLGQRVLLGVRPQRVSIGDGMWRMCVRRVEHLVHRSDVTLAVGDCTITASGGHVGATVRDEVHVEMDVCGALLFEDGPMGRRFDVEVPE